MAVGLLFLLATNALVLVTPWILKVAIDDLSSGLGGSALAAYGGLLVAVAALVGCGGYGEASPKAYAYATALYSVCNRRAEQSIVALTDQIEAAQTDGTIGEVEAPQ